MRSLEQIKQELIDYILALRSDIKIVAGDTQHDVVVASPSNQFYRFEILLEFEDRTRNLNDFTNLINDEDFKTTLAEVLGTKQDGSAYTVDDINTWISERLDAYVDDFGITRSAGTAASGTIRLYLYDATPVSWSTSTEFTSKTTSYLATSSITNIIPILDSTTGLYYVDVPVEASVTGSSGNAVVGAVTGMTTKPSNFSYCSNVSAISGGTDEETDLNLISRCQEVKTQRVGGSKAYLEGLAEEQTFVDDVITIDTDDPENDIYVGSVCDVFSQFTGEDLEVVEENIYWPGEADNPNEEIFTFVPKNQPLSENFTPTLFRYAVGSSTEVQIVPDGTNTIVEIVKDSGTFSGSTKAMDVVRVRLAHNTGTYKRVIKLLYGYDKQPYKLQNVFDIDTERLVGPLPLVRKAIEVPVKVVVEPSIAFGYDQTTVQDTITSNLECYFNGGTTSFGKQYARKGIGADISHSDISNIILRTAGVVSFDFDTFFVINTLTGDRNDPVVVTDNQYAILSEVAFTYETFNASE